MGERRTAWHYFLGLMLDEMAPRCFEIRAEEPLTRAIQHMDWLILRRHGDPAPGDRGQTLVDLWPLLPRVTVVEFKSAAAEYRARDVHRLLGYGYQYFSAQHDELAAHDDLALVLMVARRNGTLDRDLAALDLSEVPLSPGYARLRGLTFSMLLVDLSTVARAHAQDFVSVFVPDARPPQEAWRWWYAHHGTRKDASMNPHELDDYDAVKQRFLSTFSLEDRLAGLAPEQRLAGLAPEQRLAGLAPEQRLAGLSEAEQVLAMPDRLLALLPESYLATLPDDVRARIAARLAR